MSRKLDVRGIKTEGPGRGPGRSRKHYRIRLIEDGERKGEWIARGLTTKGFECNGTVGTLKEIKEKILCGEIPLDLCLSEEAEAYNADVPERPGTWDCVEPCALLAYAYSLQAYQQAENPKTLREIKRTLDNNGWLTPDGEPDLNRASREFQRGTRDREARKAVTEIKADIQHLSLAYAT